MSEFAAVFQTPGGAEVPPSNEVQITPLWYSFQAKGGCEGADIEVSGHIEALWPFLRWLGYRVFIQNRNRSHVWWGFIEEVLVSTGSYQVGVSLKNMRNRVQVIYTKRENASSVQHETDWMQDDESVSRFGYRELMDTLAETTDDGAIARQTAILDAIGMPPAIQSDLESNTTTATIRCSGWFSTLGWRYYAQPRGLEANDVPGGGDQPMGQGLSSASNIGFATFGKISDLIGRLRHFTSGTKVSITGSTSNNIASIIEGVDNREARVYSNDTISFDAADDIMDSDDDLSFTEVDDFILVSGSSDPDHNRVYLVKEAGGDHIVVVPRNVATVAAGDTIVISRGNSIEVENNLTREYPSGSTVTITVHGQKVAQWFGLDTGLSWTVDRIAVPLWKVGAPADNVTLELCADNSGVPGTVLDSATIAGANLTTVRDWVVFELSNADTITAGSIYWIVISRSGANDYDDYYMMEADEDQHYTRGAMRLYTGASWVAREPAAHLVFRVLGAELTTTQIEDIIETSGQFFEGTDIINSSGVYTNQYRDGQSTALDEVLALLNHGSSNGRRMLAMVTPERYLRVYEQPGTTSEAKYMQLDDSRILTQAGNPIEHGKVPVGEWVERAGIPATIATMHKLSPFFVERAEVNCKDGKIRLEPQGMPDAWAIGDVVAG